MNDSERTQIRHDGERLRKSLAGVGMAEAATTVSRLLELAYERELGLLLHDAEYIEAAIQRLGLERRGIRQVGG